ncbi:hypothetical protein KCU74_g4432, partial [Aureobasidium melanogenum]
MAPTSDQADGGSRYRTRRTLQLHRDNATELGASRSRSRSRSERLSTRMSRKSSSSRQRDKSILGRAYHYTTSKQTVFLMLLALVNILLSWFGFGVFAYPGTLVRSIAKQVWMPSDSNMAEVRHDLCQVPLVPRVLHCDELTEKEKILWPNSIENVIPSIAFALSENPDAVDSIFDLLEDIRNELALMRHDIEVIESAELNAPIPIRSKETQSTMVTIRLLNATAVRFQSNLVGYDAFRDWLLENMYLRLRALDPQLVYDADQMVDPDYTDEDTWSRPLLTTVSDDLSHFIAVLERIGTSVILLDRSWGHLSNQTRTSLYPLATYTASNDCDDLSKKEQSKNMSTAAVQQLSLLKRFILWSLPSSAFPHLEKSAESIKRPSDNAKKLRTELLLAKIQAIHPLLQAIRASLLKAHDAANTAYFLVRHEETSWLRWVFGRKSAFDEDMMDGLRHLGGLVPMLMEQRRRQRADRAYQRSKARLELGGGV